MVFGNARVFSEAKSEQSRFTLSASDENYRRGQSTNEPRLLACIDDLDGVHSLAPHALAVACSLGLKVTFARVIELRRHFSSPADPITWHSRQCAERENLRKLVSGQSREPAEGGALPAPRSGTDQAIDSVLLAGNPGEELADWAKAHDTSVIAMHRRDSHNGPGLGATAQALMNDGNSSLLLVPPKSLGDARYRRILVPIDGSARAESIMPLARRIARTHRATLILVHVVPKVQEILQPRRSSHPGLVAEFEASCEEGARAKMETLRRRSVEDGVPVRVMTVGPADARTELCRIIRDQRADMVVMSSHGCTGLEDIPCGSVTDYVAGHSDIPVLIVRPNIECRFGPEPVSCVAPSAFRFP
ncbi:universal stress protein [Aurantiacibacter marinus]|uniref:UspA domain-containing protein n=1 Tax=Aurantiacibacter marinus TaxID=874156 RepID=A0A0H0XLP7_9SPHN|nr:universal stress protein [Aurantiacibacter marinus]KLI62916.1 hypothetical protein AAV99_12700 [Aurantiacibacter marinus]